eukprot:s294_g8.t1
MLTRQRSHANATFSLTTMQEVLESLQGCWQNVKEPTEFYMVQQMSVTRFRQKTGEVFEFSRVLRPDSTNSGVQWGLQGRFIMQVDTAATENTLELRFPWEPGTAGVKGWQWQRVDPALTPFRGFESNVASQQEVTPAPAAAVPVQDGKEYYLVRGAEVLRLKASFDTGRN